MQSFSSMEAAARYLESAEFEYPDYFDTYRGKEVLALFKLTKEETLRFRRDHSQGNVQAAIVGLKDGVKEGIDYLTSPTTVAEQTLHHVSPGLSLGVSLLKTVLGFGSWRTPGNFEAAEQGPSAEEKIMNRRPGLVPVVELMRNMRRRGIKTPNEEWLHVHISTLKGREWRGLPSPEFTKEDPNVASRPAGYYSASIASAVSAGECAFMLQL